MQFQEAGEERTKRTGHKVIQRELESNDLPAWDLTGLQSDQMNKMAEEAKKIKKIKLNKK